MKTQEVPRVLLVEDDPTSRAFITAALAGAPGMVDGVDSIDAAFAHAASQRYDLLMIDAHLPDGSGAELLGRLRRSGVNTPALAHTASADASLSETLRAAGFLDVLVKPLPVRLIQASVRNALGMGPEKDGGDEQRTRDPVRSQTTHTSSPSPARELPLWDDAAAARALGGNGTHIEALRDLFVAELPMVAERIRLCADTDAATVRAELHKLRASCGFVGAARLGDVVQALGVAIDGRAIDSNLLTCFDELVRGTLDGRAAWRQPATGSLPSA